MKPSTRKRTLQYVFGSAAMAILLMVTPWPAHAWGATGQKLIVDKAVDTLPGEVQAFFGENRSFLVQHVGDSTEAMNKTPSERKGHFLYLDRYGKFPYDRLPRDYNAALAKFTKAKLEANGLLPWQIGVYSEKLTEALKAGKWDEARTDAAWLASYVADAHDPFHTTENFEGQLSNQPGVQERFGAALIDRFASFFPLRPNDAIYIGDPTDHAFEACLSAHSWIENVLLADRNSRRGLPSYTDEYYDRFYNQAAAILIRQLSDASTDVGSYWYTAWVNAGKPTLPQH